MEAKKSRTCIIVDDELHARESLKGMINTFFPELVILAECKNLKEGVDSIRSLNPEIVFLDIEMPGYSGLDILDFFDKSTIQFQLIFVTAYSEFAVNAFELSAVDYLLKPIQQNQLERALSKVEKIKDEQVAVLKEHLSQEQVTRIAVNTSQGMVFIPINDVIYVKADGSYSFLILKNNERIYVSKKLLEFDRLQQIGRFLRIHRSHIVNINHITKLLKNDGGSVIMSNGEELSIAQDKRQVLEAMITEPKF